MVCVDLLGVKVNAKIRKVNAKIRKVNANDKKVNTKIQMHWTFFGKPNASPESVEEQGKKTMDNVC
jgi:hypothetical protein